MQTITASEMRALEQEAIASGRVIGLELMERAGQGVVEAIFEEWPELTGAPHRAIVLCGPGNNGGDGFVVARLLKERGWEVEVLCKGDPARLPEDARINYARWAEIGPARAYCDAQFPLDACALGPGTVFIDALFGMGLSRPVTGMDNAAWATQISEWRLPAEQCSHSFPCARVVAVDVPSGLDTDKGALMLDENSRAETFRADLTVTFHAPKPGHLIGDGPEACGKLVVKDIGL